MDPLEICKSFPCTAPIPNIPEEEEEEGLG